MGEGREFVWWKLHSAVSVLEPGRLLAISGGLFGGWIGSMVTLPPDAGWRRIIVVAAFAFVGLAGAGGVSAVLLAALYRWLSAPAPVERTASPISVLRQDRFAALLALPPHLLVGGIAGMYLDVDLSQIQMEQAVNVVAVVIGIAVGAAAWIGYTLTSTAWGWFCLIHVRLALTGALPWRLMRFLANAHRRRVLRQTGPVYEFRHSRLQDFLRTHND
ncbi:hypothetical protein ACGFIK_14860 [Micromonospora sp. NPDC048871]|uniref:hypothetical protein n=1 Tax=unclassified Micromonospora TaxID=2617518 RepID=UPI002E0FABDF|nr:hypothetical protein OIE53_10810 [Micromonospora sp. NBC_01739]